MRQELTSRDWFGKASAGLLLGFVLALGLSGWFKLLAGLGETFFSSKGQVSMWLIAPVWAGILSFCFFFRSGPRAWGWLGLASALVWGLLFLAGGVRA